MTTVVIVIHLMVVLAMIGLVLLQRSEGGALGIGGGSGAFMSGRGAGNMLTRSTAVLAAVFFATSIGLALLARIESRPSDILDQLPGQTAPVTSDTPAAPAPMGAPTSADDLLRSLGGPQTPPAGDGEAQPDAPAAQAPAAPVNGTAADGAAAPADGAAASGDGTAAPGNGATAPAAGGSQPAAQTAPAPAPAGQ